MTRSAGSDGRQAIATLEARYRETTGINTLKIKHNAVLGYFIEVPARHGDSLMTENSGFTHRQTLAGVVRFNSTDLHEEAVRVSQAGAHALAAEAAHFEELVDMEFSSGGWLTRFKSLKERLEHHMKEEEEEIFVAAKKDLSAQRAQELAAIFDKRKPVESQEVA